MGRVALRLGQRCDNRQKLLSQSNTDAEMNEDANSTAIVAPIQAQGVPLVGTQLRELVPAPRPTPLPVALPVSKPKRARRRWRRTRASPGCRVRLGRRRVLRLPAVAVAIAARHRVRRRQDRGGRDRHRHQVRRAHRRNARRRRRHGQSVSGSFPHGHEGSRSVASQVRITGPTGPAEPR